MPHRVDKSARLLQPPKPLDLDWSMADHSQQLLVRPDICLERCNVEVAYRDHRSTELPLRREPCRDFIEELQFMGEFRVCLGIWNIASRRHVDIVKLDAIGELDHGMPAIFPLTPVARRMSDKGQP